MAMSLAARCFYKGWEEREYSNGTQVSGEALGHNVFLFAIIIAIFKIKICSKKLIAIQTSTTMFGHHCLRW